MEMQVLVKKGLQWTKRFKEGWNNVCDRPAKFIEVRIAIVVKGVDDIIQSTEG